LSPGYTSFGQVFREFLTLDPGVEACLVSCKLLSYGVLLYASGPDFLNLLISDKDISTRLMVNFCLVLVVQYKHMHSHNDARILLANHGVWSELAL